MKLLAPFVLLLALTSSAGCGVNPVDAETTAGGLTKLHVGSGLAGSGTVSEPLISTVTMSTGGFGDGTDGACVFDTSTTTLGLSPTLGSAFNLDPPYDTYYLYLLPRDIFCSTITIANNTLLDSEDFRVFASTSIVMNGNALLGPIGCSGWAGGGAFTGLGGCQATAGSIPTAGGIGGNGNTGAGSVGGNAIAPVVRGYTGTGGNGGAGAAAAGTGGTVGAGFAAGAGDLHTLPACILGRTGSATAIGSTVSGGGGGGGGDNGTHHGGGGGGGGGYLVVASPLIVTNSTSTLTAAGGRGGAGATGGGATGGGGGGMGGLACVAIGGGTQPSITVAGGVGGAGGSGGAAGSAGHAGLVLSPTGGAWVVGIP